MHPEIVWGWGMGEACESAFWTHLGVNTHMIYMREFLKNFNKAR